MSRARKLHEPIDAPFADVLTAIADERKPAFKIDADARPFLKWAGGKRSIIDELTARLPETYTGYYELFLGGAALFYAVKPTNAYLSDLNFHLVLTYLAVRDDVERLISNLKVHEAKHREPKPQRKEYYERARTRIAKEQDLTKIGALLIYLNKTCYNGLYRVNQSGAFNVPMGSYPEATVLDEANLRACSKALQRVEIKQHSFLHAPVVKGAFYYLDPPYHKTFSSFDSSGFNDADHEKLAEFCKALDKAGCYFMVSNSDTALIRRLYQGFHIEPVTALRFVSCKVSGRGKQNELIIRNYTTFQRKEGPKNGQPS